MSDPYNPVVGAGSAPTPEPAPAPAIAATPEATTGDLTMVDSAFPLAKPPSTDIVLLYGGGDTPHTWTKAEVDSQPARYRLPTFVRSDPGSANAANDAQAFEAWLNMVQAPKGITVVLDLETAVDAEYVNAFNAAMGASDRDLTMKYGSKGFLFNNPKTSGGSFVADPTGTPHMFSEGDTVATQYDFQGQYDLSLVKPSVALWDTQPPPPPGPYWHAADGRQSLAQVAAARGTTVAHLVATTEGVSDLTPAHRAEFLAYLNPEPGSLPMPKGLVYYTENP